MRRRRRSGNGVEKKEDEEKEEEEETLVFIFAPGKEISGSFEVGFFTTSPSCR